MRFTYDYDPDTGILEVTQHDSDGACAYHATITDEETVKAILEILREAQDYDSGT